MQIWTSLLYIEYFRPTVYNYAPENKCEGVTLACYLSTTLALIPTLDDPHGT